MDCIGRLHEGLSFLLEGWASQVYMVSGSLAASVTPQRVLLSNWPVASTTILMDLWGEVNDGLSPFKSVMQQGRLQPQCLNFREHKLSLYITMPDTLVI